MDPIKEAFSNIKRDINLLRDEIFKIKNQLDNIQTQQISQNTIQSTNQQTHIQTQIKKNIPIQPLYTQNIDVSIGNDGVQTNKPTNQQTDQLVKYQDFKQVNKILESLDNIKKEIRLKFKRLTNQEMFIFSTLYTLEEQNYREITYRTIAEQVNLSESSIRDYINKLIIKGVPVEKTKQNNKTIILNISEDLKKITTLVTIQNLREI